jgi:hypothetical protein
MKPTHNPSTDRGRLDQALASLLSDLDGLVNLWRQTDSMQWERSLSRESSEDTGIRSQGGHSDPTGDTATDKRRLNVRHQRVRVMKEMDQMAATMSTLHNDLQKAVKSWG